MAEQSGHGVPIIVSEYSTKAFSFDDGLIKVTLKYAYEPNVVTARKNQESDINQLNNNQLRVFNYLSDHPEANLQEVSLNLNLSLSGVKKIVGKLQELEIIKRSGAKRNGRWEKVDFKSRL